MRAIRFLLLVGVLFGLFGQAAAYSQIPVQKPVEQKVAAGDDCMEAMAQAQKEKPKAPCRGLTPDCIAAMGCVTPMIVGKPLALDPAPIASSAPIWSDAPVLLSGRSVAPDPHPPSLV